MIRARTIAAGVALVGLLGLGAWFALTGPDEPLDAELVGFRLRAADGVPTFDRDALPVMRAASDGPVTARWLSESGREVAVGTTRVEAAPGARLLEVTSWSSEPEPGPGTLVLQVGSGVHRWAARWAVSPESLPAIAAISTHRKAGELAAARKVLAAGGEADPQAQLWLGVERARIEQTAGDADAAITAWLDAADEAHRLGVPTEESRRLRAAAYVAWQSHRSAQMEEILSRAVPVDTPTLDPRGHALLRYYQGLSGLLLGDWRGARTAFEAALTMALRIGEHSVALLVTEGLASLLDELGDPTGALTHLLAFEPNLPRGDRAARMRFTVNIGWLTLRSLPPKPSPAEVATLRARLDAGRAAADEVGSPTDIASAAVNQAWGAIELGDLDAAEKRLAEARALDPDEQGFAAPYATLLQARVDHARGRLDAAEAGFRRLATRATRELGEVSELRWRALLGIGRVMISKHDAEAARQQFDEALQIVDALGRRASLRGDRSTFHADRSALVEEAINLSIEREPWRAFGYADAARSRPMRALQADLRVGALDPETRRQWAEALDTARIAADDALAAYARLKVAPVAEEPAARAATVAADRAREAAFDAAFAVLDRATPAPPGITGGEAGMRLRPDELLFAFHGDWAFRVDHAWGAIARRVTDGDPLGDWRALPPDIRHVYIVPGGRPDAFKLATDGETPLLTRASVSFLPYAGLLAQPDRAAEGPPLIVADPRRDLSFAAAEGEAVAKALPGATLLSGPAADRAAVLAALANARLFHFAGHGALHPERPWDAHLRLAGADTLSLSDVLTHPVGARMVMLSGCETGVDAVLLDEAVVGLPEAFLAAGARAVLATDREVDDRVTRRFVERFYAAGGAAHPAEALRIASLAAREAGDPAWSAFRMLGLRAPPPADE